jgi:hypothetical protein
MRTKLNDWTGVELAVSVNLLRVLRKDAATSIEWPIRSGLVKAEMKIRITTMG